MSHASRLLDLDVLRRRANELANRRARKRVEDEIELVVFELDEHRVGIRGRAVERVLSEPKVLRFPGASEAVPGVVMHRDDPIGLVDLSILFDAKPIERVNAVVVARGVAGTLAIAARAIVGLVAVSEADLLPFRGGPNVPFVRQLTQDLVKVLDHDALTLDPRITGQSNNPSENSP